MTPVPTLPGTPAPPQRGNGGKSAAAKDAFSNVLDGPAARPRARNGDSQAANRQGGSDPLIPEKEAMGRNADEKTGPEIRLSPETRLPPLERLALIFGEKVVSDRSKDEEASSGRKEEITEAEEEPSRDGDGGKSDEIEMAEEALPALVVRDSSAEPERRTGKQAAEEPGRKTSSQEFQPLRPQMPSADNRSQNGQTDGGSNDGIPPENKTARATAANVEEAPGRGQKQDRGDGEMRSVPRPANASSQSDVQVKVVGDTLSMGPVAPDSSRTIAGLTAAITEDGEWRTAIEKLNALGTDAPKSQQVPVRDLKIQLNPANLGEVNARLRLSGEQLTVEIHVDSKEAYSRLSGDRDAIISSLRGLGFRVDEVTIQQQQPANGQPQSSTGGRANDTSSGLSQGSGREQGGSGGGSSGHREAYERDSDAKVSRGRPSGDGLYI